MIRRWRADNVYYLIAAFNGLMFTGMAVISTVYRVEVANLNPLQLVLVGTVLEIAYFSTEVPTGIVADMYSRRLSVIIGYLLIGLGFMVEGAFPVFGMILVAQVIWGVGATFTSGAQEAWLSDEMGQDRLTGIFLRASQVGSALAFVGTLGAMTLGTFSLQLTFFLSGAGIFALGLALIVVMPETGFTPLPRSERSTWHDMASTFREGVRHVRAGRILTLIFAIELVIGLSSEGIDRLSEAHLLESFTFPDLSAIEPIVWIGGIALAGNVLEIIMAGWLRRQVSEKDRVQSLRYQRVFSMLFLGSIVLFAAGVNFTMGVAALMSLRLFRSAGNPLYRAWLNHEITQPNVRATVLSMFGQVNAIGQIVGGPIIGLLATLTSLGIGFLGVALLMAPVPILYTIALRWTRADRSPGIVSEASPDVS